MTRSTSSFGVQPSTPFLMLSMLILESRAQNCKFLNLNCITINKKMLEFNECKITAVSRYDNYVSVAVHLKEIVQAVTVRISLYKRANGWKPFLYDVTFDGCKFLKSYKVNPVAYFFYNILMDFANLNHTCPYDHDIVFNKFRILHDKVRLPFPNGAYAVDTQWILNNKRSARINFSCVHVPS